MLPSQRQTRRLSVADARKVLVQQEAEKLIDKNKIHADAIGRVEQSGIVFLDELDKVAGNESKSGPDVSRQGVQRDLLPIVEGSNVQTKYGMVKTDHVLFIAAGAFHVSKPSDLIPELQGRFPIRVELKPLTEEDFVRIMTEPENALTKQYAALVEAEGANLSFTSDGIAEIARIATSVNGRMENIGARRLHTVMTTLLEDVLYELPDRGTAAITVDRQVVNDRLRAVMEVEDEVTNTGRREDSDHAADERLAVDGDGGLGADVGQRLQSCAEAGSQEQRARRSTVSCRHPMRRIPCPDR